MTGLCRHLPLWIALLLSSILAACGGGSAPNEAPATVARVVISPSSVLLTAAGASQQLSAQALDADGQPLDVAVTWASSRPDQLAVGTGGLLTAQAAVGSAQITATAGGVSSAPMLALAATPAAGVMLVDDANLVGDAIDTDPNAEPNADNTYQVTLTGVPAPAVGTLMLGRGERPLAGRVVASAAMGTQTLLTLQLVPLPELFAELEIEEILDLSRAEVLIPSDVEAQFNVARNGNTWTFAPKATPPTTQRARPQNVTGTYSRDILPFRSCEASFLDFENVTDLPIGLDPPSFSITLDPTLDYYYSRRGGLTRFIVNAESKVELSAALKAQAALSGGLKCKLQLFALRLPIGGPLAFFVGGYLPVGVGFELQASATLASFKLGAQAEAGTKASLGWSCPPSGPECTFVRSMENSRARIEPLYEAPTLNGNMRLEAGLSVFGYVEAELGNPFLRSLRFKALETRIGGKSVGSFETSASQLLNLDYASKYRVALTGSAGTGIGVGDTLRLLGFTNLTSLALEFSVPLAESPQAQSVHADRASFAAGETVNVKVTLDPATLNFLPDTYNVKTVQLRRRVGDASEVLAAQTASTGQQVFEFAVTAPTAGNVSAWSAFVVTRLLEADILSLELGPVQSNTGIVVVRDFNLTNGGCEASAHSRTAQPPPSIRDETLPAACNAAYAGARASVTVAPVVTGPSLVIGEEVQNNALAFSFQIEISPEQQVAQPLHEVAWAYGHAQAQRESVFRVDVETRMGVSFDYATTGGGRIQPGTSVTVRKADGTLREAFLPGQGREVVLHPGDTVRVYVGVEAFARAQSEIDPRFADQPRSATVQANVVLRFNP